MSIRKTHTPSWLGKAVLPVIACAMAAVLIWSSPGIVGHTPTDPGSGTVTVQLTDPGGTDPGGSDTGQWTDLGSQGLGDDGTVTINDDSVPMDSGLQEALKRVAMSKDMRVAIVGGFVLIVGIATFLGIRFKRNMDAMRNRIH